MNNFVNLKVKTGYAMFGEICKGNDLISKAKEYKMSALAKTDWGRGGFYGNIEFYKECKENNIKPIIGINSTLKDNNEKVFITLYAKDFTGYNNLIRIFANKFRPSLDDIIKNYNSLLCVITPYAEYENQNIISKLKKVFQDDLYLGITGEGEYYKKTKELALLYNVKTVIFDAVCYVERDDVDAYRTAKKIIESKNAYGPISDEEYEKDLYFKSYEEIVRKYLFDLDSIHRTQEIADKCNLVFDTQEKEICKCDENKLKQEIYEGIKIRGISVTEEVKDRIELEWETFKKNGQLNYINFFKELCAFAKNNNISIGSGRGPVCASLILYALNITEINPLNFDLIFERIPKKLDIDIDVEPSGSEKILNHLKEVYGENNVLGVTHDCSYYTQGLLVDVAKAYNCSEEYINKISNAFIKTRDKYSYVRKLADVLPLHFSPLYQDKELIELYRQDEMFRKIAEVVDRLEGISFSKTQHACKWIIKSDNEIVPVAKIGKEEVAMLNANEVEYLGVFNIDILKLSPLKNIKDTVSLIHENYGTDILFDADKCDDEKTFNLINSLDTENIFELFGSEGANELIKKYPVKNLNDLSFIIAMFRPYMDELKPSCDEEVKLLLNSYLSETHGLLIYQEQLMNILHGLADFSYEEAEGARRQIAKRKYDNKPDYKALFMERAIAKFGVKLSNKIWDYLYDIGKYCFLKAHSISYAFMSYQTACLKTNYRKEFDEIFSREK